MPRTIPLPEREWLSWTISSGMPSSPYTFAAVGLAEETPLVGDHPRSDQNRSVEPGIAAAASSLLSSVKLQTAPAVRPALLDVVAQGLLPGPQRCKPEGIGAWTGQHAVQRPVDPVRAPPTVAVGSIGTSSPALSDDRTR